LTEHRETTFNLMVQTASQGLSNVPVALMTDARRATIRKAKCEHGQSFEKNKVIRLIEQAEAAAVQMYIKNIQMYIKNIQMYIKSNESMRSA
jgi:hypothetical protein